MGSGAWDLGGALETPSRAERACGSEGCVCDADSGAIECAPLCEARGGDGGCCCCCCCCCCWADPRSPSNELRKLRATDNDEDDDDDDDDDDADDDADADGEDDCADKVAAAATRFGLGMTPAATENTDSEATAEVSGADAMDTSDDDNVDGTERKDECTAL
jgi:hypothetical protein